MQKFCLNKKSFKQNHTSPPLTQPPPGGPRQLIKPYINHKRLIYEEPDFKRLLVKRPQFHNFRIDCNSTYFYIRNPLALQKIHKKFKNLRNLELHALLFSHKVSLTHLYKLLRKFYKISSLKLYFGTVYIPQSEAEISRIRAILKNIRANVKRFVAEIYLGNGANLILSWFIRTAIRTIQTMSNLKDLRLSLPKLGSKVGTVFQQQIDPCIEDEALFKLCEWRFQALRKLESVEIPFLVSQHPILESFTKKFSHLSNLKVLEVVCPNIEFGKRLTEELKSLKTLGSLTLYHWVNPDDLLNLIVELPNLTKLTIREDWMFRVDTDTVFDQVECEENNVTCLQFDFPMDVSDEDQSKLFSNFISYFYNLQSLKIYICCEESIALLEPIAKVISHLEYVSDLTLGLFLRSGKVFGQFLKKIGNIVHLEKLTLMMKLSFGSTWDQTNEVTFKALEGFLLRNKSLKYLELFWEKFSPTCLESLREILLKVPWLKQLMLAYISVYREHGQVHTEIINRLAKALKELTKFENIVVITSCPAYLYEGCERKAREIRKSLEKVCIETATPISTPFYNDNLLF